MSSPVRLAWLATHPIQYQAPLLRAIARSPDIDLTALFFSDFSTRGFSDPGFGRVIEWDTSLLEGYHHEFLPGTGSRARGITLFEPIVRGLAARLTRRNFDAVLVQGWQHYGMLQGAWLARHAGLMVLMRCEATDHFSLSRGPKRWLREAIVRQLLGQIDRCMAIGSHNRDFYLRRGFPSERIGFMPYCVDNDYFRLKAQAANVERLRAGLALTPGSPVILYAGKLIARKYPHLLLDAYRRLPEPRPALVYVGDGEMRAGLEQTVHSFHLDQVRFTGFRNQGELPSYYALADIFVLPAVNETWGLVINEAMNAGCAIVTTDQVGSAPDLVRSGENGFVVAPRSSSDLAEALDACLANRRFQGMGERSLRIIENWGIPENVDGLRAAFGTSVL